MNRTIVILFSLILSCSSKAKKERLLSNIPINDYYEGKFQLHDIAPSPYWTLIILNSNLAISNKFLEKLVHRKLDLSSTVILLIGVQEGEGKDVTQKYHTQYQDKLMPYSWINNINSDTLKQLKVSGTPVVLGMRENNIHWQISGLSKSHDFNKISNHLMKWANKKDLK